MKTRFLAAVVISLLALCWLDSPKAQAYRGFGGFYRGGWGRGWGGWGRGWGVGFRGWGFGWNRPWFRPWYGGFYRPWFRPFYWAGYRPWGLGRGIYAGGYSPYYYGSYSAYAAPYYYGDSYYCPPSNGSYVPPVMPRSDNYFYNGGPQTMIPIPETTPTFPSTNRFVSVFPAYGEKARPITTVANRTPPVSYPAYGEQASPPTTLVSSSKR
jgi:hypothetical protein